MSFERYIRNPRLLLLNPWSRTIVVLSGVGLFIALSAWAYMPWWELAFRSDKSPVSWLSSSLLFACAALALQSRAQRGLSLSLSSWLTVSMLALALDEQFLFHEYWKYHCSEWLSLCALPSLAYVDLLGDAPMVLVGCIGIATGFILSREIDTPIARKLILAAIIFGVVLALGTHFGHAIGLLPAWFNRYEEVFEVLSETLFLCALLEIRAKPDN